MSSKMSSFRSFVWRQRFGNPPPDAREVHIVQGRIHPVEAPARKPVRNEPMSATVRMGHYLHQLQLTDPEMPLAFTRLTPAQKGRWLKKLNRAGKRARNG